jgi:hypothetical protein
MGISLVLPCENSRRFTCVSPCYPLSLVIGVMCKGLNVDEFPLVTRFW